MDAVVVGAGHNGLVAANMLADAGWDVVVLEASATAGGAVRSAEIVTPGYISDLCSAFYPFAACSPAFQALRLEQFGLRWCHAPAVLAHVLPDNRVAVLSRDIDVTADSLERFAEGDGRRWRAAYRDWLPLSADFVRALLTPFPPMRAGLRLFRQLHTRGAMRLARRMVLPAGVLGEELFRGVGAQLLLTGCAMHTDLSPQDATGGIFGWLLAMLGQQHGFPVPEGGAGRITDALVERLHRRGGTVEFNTHVAHIEVAQGKAVAVSCVDGRRWRAKRAVVADVPAPALYLELLEHKSLPSRLIEDMDHFRWDGSTVKLDWALSAPVPWANKATADAGTVHLGLDAHGLTRYAAQLAVGEVPDEPFVIAGQMTTADPTRSPAGTQSMWAYTHLPHRPDWDGESVAAQAQRVEKVIEGHAPGFTETIVGRQVSGPANLEDENPSLVGGSLGGGTSAAYQQLVFRPVPGLGRADTPIDRLFLASASAHPGGGVHGAPGANAARAALARDRMASGAVYRAAIKLAHRAIYG